jgi:hypothetical protein
MTFKFDFQEISSEGVDWIQLTQDRFNGGLFGSW